MIFPFFTLFVLVVVGGAVVALGVMWWRVVRGPRGGDLPQCGRCGYAVRGTQSLNCPECGGDLREVGITTPKQRGRVGPVAFVVLWTLLLPVPGCLVSGILMAVGPQQHSSYARMSLTPESGAYNSATVEYSSTYTVASSGVSIGSSSSTQVSSTGVWNTQFQFPSLPPNGAVDYITLQLDLSNNVVPQASAMEIDPAGGAYYYTDALGSTVRGQAVDADAVTGWLRDAGVAPVDAAVEAEAAELVKLVDALRQRRPSVSLSHFNNGGMTTSSGTEPATWYLITLLLLWLLLYAGGIVYYFRLHRRRFAPRPARVPAFA